MTPANETIAPASFGIVRVSEPTATAIRAVSTGVAAISTAESPAEMRPSAVVQRIW